MWVTGEGIDIAWGVSACVRTLGAEKAGQGNPTERAVEALGGG